MEYRRPVIVEESDSSSDISETDQSLGAEPILWHYYRVAFALIRGGIGRRSLPFELVIHICEFAGFISPYPSKLLSARFVGARTPPRRYCRLTPPRMEPPKFHSLLKTPALSSKYGRRPVIEQAEIVVKCLRNGYRIPEYWSRFFIQVSRSSTSDMVIEDVREKSWPCFDPIQPPENSQVSEVQVITSERRVIIGQNHEVWQCIRPGDSLEVAVKYYRATLPDNECDTIIRIFERWEPSPAMLRFA
ncbi:hypothetical protein BDV93DRAFT_563130 [Ceratobasidium sp. AG-I]|nr:hypothetical protein BDV93DRAFT_563130 [Ceratobasidium sp. AG-I]